MWFYILLLSWYYITILYFEYLTFGDIGTVIEILSGRTGH